MGSPLDSPFVVVSIVVLVIALPLLGIWTRRRIMTDNEPEPPEEKTSQLDISKIPLNIPLRKEPGPQLSLSSPARADYDEAEKLEAYLATRGSYRRMGDLKEARYHLRMAAGNEKAFSQAHDRLRRVLARAYEVAA